jgi:hypothetical protein
MRLYLLFLLSISAVAVAQKGGRPPVHFYSEPNSFYADGRWVSPKGKSEFQSETQLNCTRQWDSCIAATAELYAGHPHVSIEYFQIVQWDKSGLVAVNADAICMKRTMVISFAEKSVSVFGAKKNMPEDTKQACATVGASEPYTDSFLLKDSPQWNANPYGENDGRPQ